MTAHLGIALLGITNAASACTIKVKDGRVSASPPDQRLLERGLKFIHAWNAWQQSQQSAELKNPIEVQTNEQFVETFFAKIEEICLKFNYYNVPGSAQKIAGLNDLIMLNIPWENLAEELRLHRLRVIFQQQEFRLQLWRHYNLRYNQYFAPHVGVNALGINPSVARVLLEHNDIRAEFHKLPLDRIVSMTKQLNLCQFVPTLFSEFSDQTKQTLFNQNPEAAQAMLLTTNRCSPTAMFALLHNSHVRRFLVSHRDTLTTMVDNNLSGIDAYLCSQFTDAATRSHDLEFEDAYIAIVQERFATLPLLPGMYLLLQEREKRSGGRRKIYEVPQVVEKLPAFIQQVYDDYFFSRNVMTPDLALQLLQPLTTLANLDVAVRIQVNLFVARIHMNRQEKEQARPYLARIDELESARRQVGVAMPAAVKAPETQEMIEMVEVSDRHAEVLSLQLLCHGQQQPYLGAEQHLPYFEPEVRELMNNLCHEQREAAIRYQQVSAVKQQITPLITSLERINHDFGDYLPKRDTQGLLYSLGIKNATLSNLKNAMVMDLRDDISGFIDMLNNLEDEAAVAPVVEALSKRLRAAELQNEHYYRQYGRAIDGPGTLGGELKRARLLLNEFRRPIEVPVEVEEPYIRPGFGSIQ